MYRNSRQRQAILKFLRSVSSHPTAEQVFEEVKKDVPNVGLATVYRNLKLLHDEGVVAEIGDIHGTIHFDGNTVEHYHFRCDRCGRIQDVPEPVDRAVEKRVAEKTGLKVTHHHLELGGICLDCQVKKEASS